MNTQQFVVNEETLTDNSTAYNIVAFYGNARITLAMIGKPEAEKLAKILNSEWVSHFVIENH